MTPRLYVETGFKPGAPISLSAAQAHYLGNVLRLSTDDKIALFNGVDGEFAAKIATLGKKGGEVDLLEQTRAQTAPPPLTLLFAPVKRGPLETIIQKATELGVGALAPIITARTVATRLNLARLQSIAIEAAEQCGRLSVPKVAAPQKLDAALDQWSAGCRLIFCDESGDNPAALWGGEAGRARPALEAFQENLESRGAAPEQWALLTGPEGGFAPEEREMLRTRPFVTPVTLGPRILRADTAAIAALTLWQATLGDWR